MVYEQEVFATEKNLQRSILGSLHSHGAYEGPQRPLGLRKNLMSGKVNDLRSNSSHDAGSQVFYFV